MAFNEEDVLLLSLLAHLCTSLSFTAPALSMWRTVKMVKVLPELMHVALASCVFLLALTRDSSAVYKAVD